MKDILHKSKQILQGRGKMIAIHEHAQDKDCVSDVRKNFIYLAQEVAYEEALNAPQVRIRKSFDSLKRDEKFAMGVRGFFYVNRHRRLIKVYYYHTLRILLHWKSALVSPKTSVSMA